MRYIVVVGVGEGGLNFKCSFSFFSKECLSEGSMWNTSTEDFLLEMENESDNEESFASPTQQVTSEEHQANQFFVNDEIYCLA